MYYTYAYIYIHTHTHLHIHTHTHTYTHTDLRSYISLVTDLVTLHVLMHTCWPYIQVEERCAAEEAHSLNKHDMDMRGQERTVKLQLTYLLITLSYTPNTPSSSLSPLFHWGDNEVVTFVNTYGAYLDLDIVAGRLSGHTY